LAKHHTGGFSRDHPVILRIEEIVTSAVGRAAAKQAADNGRPALEGVDSMLREALGDDYGPFEPTSWAGTFVATEMRKLGYKKEGKRRLPTGCVAKSGAFFRKN
jgi:hypothetical protein